MALAPGTRLGVYEVTQQIGEGGMGQVSCLRREAETLPSRDIFLPSSVAADHDRLARFQRQAEVVASLNHPSIAGIYGLNGQREFLGGFELELVDWEDLAG